MARTNRRDCRVGQRKKNNINIRVEQQQRAIRKAKKLGLQVPEECRSGVAKGFLHKGEELGDAELTPAANDFLAQMKADVTAHVSSTRARLVPPTKAGAGEASSSNDAS